MPDASPQAVTGPSTDTLRRPRWWLELELLLLVLFVAGAFFTRMTDLTVRGEESRRALIAREMLATGDWIVPRCQGLPLFSRPPLQNWLIALVGMARGDVDTVALRLPSDCAILLTVILIYGYARTFLTRFGALTAGAAYASMGQVLELGRTGETDALFTLFVSGSLLLWHLGMMRGESPYKTWCLSYLFVALGMLTKGPQAPVYFAGVVGAYLLWTRDWRLALSRAHAAGIGLFLAVFGSWQIAYFLSLGAKGAGQMYVNDVGHRFLDTGWVLVSTHLAEYPFETLACMLPWSSLLVVWFNPRFRATMGRAGKYALFLALCLAIPFPTVWLPPGSRPRYFMSLYPCVALLSAIVADRIARTRSRAAWRISWPVFVRSAALAMAAIGLALLVVSLGDSDNWLKQTPTIAGLYAGFSLVAAGLAWWSTARQSALRRRAAVFAVAGFVALTYDTVLINAFQATTVDTAGAIAALKRQLPQGTQLVSFDQTHHMFAYYYRQPIPVIPYPESADEVDESIRYFCVEANQAASSPLPFPWEPIADIRCDRHVGQGARWRVIVGHRTDIPATAKQAARPSPPSIGRK